MTTYYGDHFATYINFKLLYCIPETNMILYFNYTSMKKEETSKVVGLLCIDVLTGLSYSALHWKDFLHSQPCTRVHYQSKSLAYIISIRMCEVHICISTLKVVRINNEIKLATLNLIVTHISLSFSCHRNTGGMFKRLSLFTTQVS